MGIAPLQLPGPLVVPQLDWSGLDKIGDALMLRNERERQNRGFEDVVNSIGGTAQPGAPAAPGAPMQAPTGPRGIRNNNFGNIKDGAFAKTLEGYKGADEGGFAVFETPEHGAQAMHSLLDVYGRKGMKTVRDVVSRWAPASDGNDVDAYAKFVANGGDPDAPIDLSNPEVRAGMAKRMSMFENGVSNFDAQGRALPMQDRVAAGAPREGDVSRVAQAAPAQVDVAALEKVIPPAAKARMLALFKVGTKESQAAAYGLLSKYVGKQDPIKLSEGDILVDPNDPSKVVGRAPGKSQTVREGGAIVQDGKVVYQAPPKAATDPGGKIEDQVAAREAIAKARGLDPKEPEVQKWILQGQYDIKPGAGDKLEEQIATREAALKGRGIDPNDARWQAYVMTGKLPNEDKLPITPTDKKAIIDADNHVLAHDQTIDNLRELKDLSKKAWGFKGSTGMSTVLAPFSQGAADTAQLNNAATANAIAQLKSIFGGNPTEGERAILLDISGSSTLPDSERQKIYARAERAVLARRELAAEQAAGIRDRTYWGPGGGKSGTSGVAPRTLSKEEVQNARADPEKVRQEARDAIAGGRDRAGVLKRLQQLKISTEGL